MRSRRLIPALSVCLAASATTALAQPTADPKTAPPSPTPGAGTGAGGQDVQMSEDAPPSDLEGRDENPDAPKIIGDEPAPQITKTAAPKPTGYPVEEVMRPITLPKNMSEVSIGPHLQFSPFQASSALRARYGITEKIQLGLTYVLGGVFDDPDTLGSDKVGFHPGKAIGVDVTVRLKDWVAARLGLPVYIDPFAIGLELGAPMKWQFADGKYAIGAFDDFLLISLNRFAPTFYQEAVNAVAASGTREGGPGTLQSRGEIRFSGYGVMQYEPKMAFFGRIGVVVDDFRTTTRTGSTGVGGLTTFIRAGVQYTPRKYLDLGLSIGFDDLAHGGSFGPAGLLAFRI